MRASGGQVGNGNHVDKAELRDVGVLCCRRNILVDGRMNKVFLI